MRELCDRCPLLIKCAATGLGRAGGFYAGVWLPWSTLTNNRAIETRRVARRQLRHMVRRADDRLSV